jgi:OTU domain-containing protein 6
MFNAISDQLVEIGLLPPQNGQDPRYARQTAANYMLAHPDDFMPFLPSITGEDSAGATEHDGLITESEFKKYCSNVAETGEWGGEPEVCSPRILWPRAQFTRQIQALSRAFKVPIHVIQRGPPTIVSHGGDGDNFGGGMTPEQSAAQGDKVVRISYHKRMYGLGEVSVLEAVGGFLCSFCSTTTRCGSPNDGLQPYVLRIMQHHETLT